MHPPALEKLGPTYASLFARSAFAQRKFVDAGGLARAARDRGIPAPFHPRGLFEDLDRAGSLSPIAFSQANYDVETTWLDPDPEVMVWREAVDFEPWDTHAWTAAGSGLPYVSERYSRWQLLYAEDALDSRSRSASTDLDPSWRPFVKLLVACQARLWPARAQRTVLLHDRNAPSDAGHVDPVEIEVERFDSEKLMSEFGLTENGLAVLHMEVGEEAVALDPIPSWYRLAELAPRRRTDAFRGSALRARDLYDACFLLRGLFFLRTGEWLPRPDEFHAVPDIPDSERHLPRAGGVRGATRDELQPALELQGLYPHRTHFVVEGETEEIVLKRLLDVLGRRTGYQLTNLRGVDKAGQHKALFAAASQYAARTVLIADVEGALATTLSRLRRDGLFSDDDDVLLWTVDGRPSSFEEANFSVAELVKAIAAAARRRDPEQGLALTADELTRLYAAAIDRADEEQSVRPALGRFALKTAEERGVRVSKRELARELADILVEAITAAGSLYEASHEGRPLLRRLWLWLVRDR